MLEAFFLFVDAYEVVAPDWLRRRALAWVYEVIEKEDVFTQYIDIGPVNKMINMVRPHLCVCFFFFFLHFVLCLVFFYIGIFLHFLVSCYSVVNLNAWFVMSYFYPTTVTVS